MIKTICAIPADVLKSNHEESVTRRIKPFRSYLRGKSFKTKKAIICAAGPSIKHFVDYIKGLDGDIFSAKTEKYLREHGISPKFDFHVDARDSEIKYINPHKDTTYLIATQCTPLVFDTLKDYTVYGVSCKLSGDWCPPNTITSGANVTSQAIILAAEMGYKHIDVFGYDCSKADDQSHVIGSDLRPDKIWFEVGVVGCEKKFITNPEMLSHARESILVAQYVASKGIQLQVHGEGLVQEVLKAVFIRGQQWH